MRVKVGGWGGMDNEGESGGLGKVWIMRMKYGVGEGMDNEDENMGLGKVWIMKMKVGGWGRYG